MSDEFTIAAKAKLDSTIGEHYRYERALEVIRGRDWVENALDPQWAARVASAALCGLEELEAALREDSSLAELDDSEKEGDG